MDDVREYSGEMEEFCDEVGEVADEVDEERFSEPGVMSEASGQRADQATDETNQCRPDDDDDKRHDAFDHVRRHDVLHSNDAELLKHPVQHLTTHTLQLRELDK